MDTNETNGDKIAGSSITRFIKFLPAYDKRDPDPRKNYGIHGVDMTCYVKGNRGAVQFKLFTGWMLPHVQREIEGRTSCIHGHKSFPADLGYHSPKPMYEDQIPMSEKCTILGGTCYYDGSGLNAEGIFDILVREGGDAMWKALDEYYVETFGALE
jgi:hypothetical protein